MTKMTSSDVIKALEYALRHVRNYHDRCYLQFLLSSERRKVNTQMQKTREMMEATHKRWSEDDWEAELAFNDSDYDEGDEACDVCGLSGIHKMSCPLRHPCP